MNFIYLFYLNGLLTKKCFKPSNLVQFEVRQGQEKRSGFPGGSFVEYLEIEVLGKIYKFFKSNSHNKFVFTVDGLSAMQPYKDESRGITVIGTWVYMIFNSDFGLKVLWDGSNTRAQVTLCSAYAGHTCGLCGNGDGNKYFDLASFWFLLNLIKIIFFCFGKFIKEKEIMNLLIELATLLMLIQVESGQDIIIGDLNGNHLFNMEKLIKMEIGVITP